MKKIPGTLYHLGITTNGDNKFNLNIWYRNRLVFEKTKILKEKIVFNVLKLLENNNLIVPRNRIEWIIKEELSDLSPTSDITFIEGTVSELLGEFRKKSADEMKKIILIGLSNAGKTCIYERVFEGKKPWELMHSAATKGITYKEYKVGAMTKPMIWDLGGQQQYLDEYHAALRKNIFRKASILLYVVDVTDIDRFENARLEFEWSLNQILSFNPNAKINVFLHKMDLIHDKNTIINHLKELFTQNISHEVKFHSTSIFDESLFTAWSEIIREISPKTTFINSILKILKTQEGVQDALLIEKTTGLACGSTIDTTEEDVTIGMISLLIVTCDRVTREMELKTFKEFRLKTTSNYILLTDVTPNLMLVIILTSSAFNGEILNEIEEVGKEVTIQIRKLWIE